MSTPLKLLGICLSLTLLAAVMAYLAGFFEPKIPPEQLSITANGDDKTVFTVTATTEPHFEEAAGTLQAKVETVVSSLITATIMSITVRSGDEVNQGDILVELDSRELDAKAEQAHQAVVATQAKLLQAERDFERVQRILDADSGAISTAEVDRAQATLHTAKAEFARANRQEDEAQTGLSYTTLKAPISGRIVDRYAEPGDTAQQGVPLLRMYHPGALRLEASVRESVASTLRAGQNLKVKIDALNKMLDAAVDEIVPSADPGSRTFLVKVSVPTASGLYPGMFGRLLVPLGETERIYVPASAVTRVGQLDFVLVKTEQGPARRYVRLGSYQHEGRIEVISGLAVGEEVLIGLQQ